VEQAVVGAIVALARASITLQLMPMEEPEVNQLFINTTYKKPGSLKGLGEVEEVEYVLTTPTAVSITNSGGARTDLPIQIKI